MWSTLAILWTVLGCSFAPIYFIALICSIVKIYRDRKRIKARNEMIRHKKMHGNGIESKGSVKRINIKIIEDEERANKYRGYLAESGSSVDERDERGEGKTKNKVQRKKDLANGHTTHVTIEQSSMDRNKSAVTTNKQGVVVQSAESKTHRNSYDGTRADAGSALVHRWRSAEIPNSPHGRDNATYDVCEPVEVGGSECSDSLAIRTPSDGGSSHANTDTEIVCDADHQREGRPLDSNKAQAGQPEPDVASKTQPHLKPPRRKHHQHVREGNQAECPPHSKDGKASDQHQSGVRRVSHGLIVEEEEKRRKDQQFRMEVMRSKSEDNVAFANIDNNLFVHEGHENHAFERSTENTRM